MGVFQIVTAQTAEPVTREEFKLHQRIDHTSDDALIDGLLAASRQHIEGETGRWLVTQTVDWKRNGFPQEGREPDDHYCPGSFMGRAFKTPSPTQSVTSITYSAASDGTSTTLSSSNYTLVTGWVSGKAHVRIPHGRICEAYNCTWPASRNEPNSVTVRMVLGFGSPSQVPAEFKAAIKLLASHWYENREGAPVPENLSRMIGNLSAGEL